MNNLHTLLRICELYARLGNKVREQLMDAVNGASDDCNANALDMIVNDFLNPLIASTRDSELALEAQALVLEINERLEH